MGLLERIQFSPTIGVTPRPVFDATHQSNVKGMYIVGDLVDAPVIKMGLHQGYEVASKIPLPPNEDPDVYDVIVIGAGPAGVGAALALADRGARFVVLERSEPFSTIASFPKGKLIFSEPQEMPSAKGLWFEDAPKEELVARWHAALAERALPVEFPHEVVGSKKQGDTYILTTTAGGQERTWRARRVILAVGKRGQPRRLGIPGEERARTALTDPGDYAGHKVVIIGGGDSAAEAAAAITEAGGEVVISYRGDAFHRAKARNQQTIQTLRDAGALRAELGTRPQKITEDAVHLRRGDESLVVPADDVLVLIGTTPPVALLRRLGVKLQGQMDWGRGLWLASFALITWLFYLLKHKKPWFPFGEGDPLAWVPQALHVDLGFRTVDASFWATTVYAGLILLFGIRAYRKYPDPFQKRRYLSLIAYQWIFLFGIPELLAPLVIERPWKVYALSVPWPLSIWSLVDAPAWADGDTVSVLIWLGLAALVTFVAIPLYVRRNGLRFCSTMCGCGGLAETLGDFWRHLAPRGTNARRSETFGRLILLLAVPVTLLILADAWGFIQDGALLDTKNFAQHWYGLVVDFWLASVLGVALYPYLGNRVWCRFFCPLRAYMEELSRRFTTIRIESNDHCIGCNECTSACQMGIDVQRFAQRQEDLSNHNSACIQCGICVQVCPMDVLKIGHAGSAAELVDHAGLLQPPRPGWERVG